MNKYIAIDVEWSSLDMNTNEMIRLGAVKIDNDVVVDSFSSFIQPKQPLIDAVEAYTGITNESLKSEPSAYDVLQNFLKFIGNETLITDYRAYSLDRINDIAQELGIERITNNTIEVIPLARDRLLLRSYTLRNLRRFLSINEQGIDEKLIALLYKKLIVLPERMLTKKEFCFLKNLFDLSQRREWPLYVTKTDAEDYLRQRYSEAYLDELGRIPVEDFESLTGDEFELFNRPMALEWGKCTGYPQWKIIETYNQYLDSIPKTDRDYEKRKQFTLGLESKYGFDENDFFNPLTKS